MKNKKAKKGFTLVELLVVITILAVLATVSVIGYRSFTKKAQVSNDTSLVAQLNIALKANEATDGKPETPTDMLEVMEENGFNVEKLTPTTLKYNIVWNQEANEFALLNENYECVYGQLEEKKYNTWMFLNDYPENSENKGYSVYLKGTTLNKELAITTGLDVGNNTNIPSISYSKTSEAQNVIIRTSGSVLTINADTDTIHHYGWVKELKVEAVANSDCYHEHGFIGKLTSFTSGRFIAETGTNFHQTQSEIEGTLGENEKDLSKAEFGEHYFNDNGVCAIETCTGTDGHRATNVEHQHSYVDGVCECGYVENKCAQGHSFTYEDKKDGKYHLAKCQNCTHEEIQEHTFNSWNLCSKCNAEKPCEHKSVMYTDNNDGATHTMKCSRYDCEYGPNSNGKVEPHDLKDGKCTKCSYVIKTFDLDSLELTRVEVEEDGKSIYKLKIADTNGLLDTENYTYVLEESFNVKLVCTQTWHSGFASFDPMKTIPVKFEQALQADGIFNYYKKTINMQNSGVESIGRVYLKQDDESSVANAEVLLTKDPFGKYSYHLYMSGGSHLSGLHHSDFCTSKEGDVSNDATGLQIQFDSDNAIYHTLIVKDKTGNVVKTLKYVSDKNQEIKIYNA